MSVINAIKKHPLLATWVLWFITRGLLVFAIYLYPMPAGDVRYYYLGLTGQEAGALLEYPAVGVWPLQILQWFNFAGSDGYLAVFITACVLVDAAFLALIQRHWRAGLFWIVFGAAVSYIFYLRIDIIQGVLVALAGWSLIRNPRVSGAIIGIAAMMKLWPAILAAGLVDRFDRSATWKRISYFAGTCAVLCTVVASYGGFGRLVSPFEYQQVRGLQIESVFASPFMVLSAYQPGKWTVEYAASRSYEVAGPGVAVAAQAASVLMLAVAALALGWALWHFVRGGWQPDVTLAWMILIVLLLIASNKVFSPQYVIWVGPLVAVALVRDGRQRIVQWLAGLLVVMAVMGTAIYPVFYSGLISEPTGAGVAWLLAARNALLVISIAIAARYVVLAKSGSSTTQTPAGRALKPEPLGQPS